MTPRIDQKSIVARYHELNLFENGETLFHQLQDHEIFVYKEGTPTALLTYGWESSMVRLQTLMEELRKNNIGFIAFDLPAHGKSSGKLNDAILSSKIVYDLLQKYPSITTLIGHSFGGGISYMSLERGSSVIKMITIGTPTHYSSVVTPFFMMLDVSPQMQQGFFDTISEVFGRDFKDYDLPAIKTKNSIQLLSIHDKNDMTIPHTDAIRMKEALNETCTLMLTEGLGHRKIMHDREVLSEIVNFIAA